MRALLAALMLVALTLAGVALGPDEVLSDPTLEARAREISSELRCLVCQNQSIDDSDADLAKDLRRIVRERLVSGDSDAEVTEFVVARYGEYVLLRPVFGLHTLVLWIAGPMLLLAGIAVLWFNARRRSRRGGEQGELTADEHAALERLTKI